MNRKYELNKSELNYEYGEYVNYVLIEKWIELNQSMIICDYLKYVSVLNCILIRKWKSEIELNRD